MTMLQESADARVDMPVALEIEDLVVEFGHGRGKTAVLKGVSMAVGAGRTVGLVGESGSGKSTIAKAIVGLVPVASGHISVAGADVAAMTRREIAELRRTVQMIPQDPYSSLDPRRTIGQTLAEAIDPRRARIAHHRDRIVEWLELVRLPADAIDRYPHEFSGGQRQRIAIARALVVEPRFVIADEITSALDVSVQAEILDLVDRLRVELDLSMLFISHNLAVVQRVSDDVTALLHGEVVEQGTVEQIFTAPEQPYTQRLLDAVPGSPGFIL